MSLCTLAMFTLVAIAASQGLGDPVTPCARDCFDRGAAIYPVPNSAAFCNQNLVNFVFTCAAPVCSADELARSNLAGLFTSQCAIYNLPVVTIPSVSPASSTSSSTTSSSKAFASSTASASILSITSIPVKYTTVVVSEYTTFCPGPTVVTNNNQTYTVTLATTLKITNCPCTITKSIETPVVTSLPQSSTTGLSATFTTRSNSTTGASTTKSPTALPSQFKGDAAAKGYNIASVAAALLGIFAYL